jgi:hypothetical protein
VKAITVKFTAGDVKHIFTASDNDLSHPTRVKHERDNSLQFEENYDTAARKLCERMNWHGTLIKGELAGNLRVYVWTETHDKLHIGVRSK